MIQRPKLLFGPYPPPAGIRRGDLLNCEYRGLVEVGGFSDGLISWPTKKKTGRRSLILCCDLVKALHKESEIAIAHWWGVSIETVWQWRKTLKIGKMTEGTTQLFRENAEKKLTPEVQQKAFLMSLEPAAREKMADSKRGKPMHKNTSFALVAAAKKPKSEAWKAKARERGKAQPHPDKYDWTQHRSILGTMADKEAAKIIGCGIDSIRRKRHEFNIPAFKAKK